MRLCVLCDDSMAPGLMHIIFVHSDGFVIKEFHFLLPFPERGGGGWESGAFFSSRGALRDDSRWMSTPSAGEMQRGKPRQTRRRSFLHVKQSLAPV